MDKSPDAFRTISEVADELDVPQHVLRFWETRFTQIKPLKRGGGRRYYRPDDVDLLRAIRHLLYGEGYTIRGVQRILKDQGARAVAALAPRALAAAPLAAAPLASAPPVAPSFSEDDEQDEGPTDEMPPAQPRLALEPRHRSEPEPSRAPAPAPRLGEDELERLKAALADIVECQRLLEQVRAG